MDTEHIFELKKGTLFFIILIVLPMAILACFYLVLIWKASPLSLGRVLGILGILIIPTLLIYFATIRTYYHSKYIIKGNLLICQMGLFKSIVFIDQINTITPGEYSAGNRHALNTKGIRINHRVGESIFLSPLKQNDFTSMLLKANPDIIIKGF